jgi:hypothetical protein
MLDTETRELTEKVIRHAGNVVREFYVGLEGPVVVGLEATTFGPFRANTEFSTTAPDYASR